MVFFSLRFEKGVRLAQKRKNMNVQKIRAEFNSGRLNENSHITELKGIGEYLANGLQRTLAPGRPRLTIDGLANRVARMNTNQVNSTLQRALQNARSNQCADEYHIRDVNKRGWRVIVALLRYLDGQKNFAFDAQQLRYPANRSNSAKHCGCISSRRRCQSLEGQRLGCTWHQSLCQPRSPHAVGFEGIGDMPGQRARAMTPQMRRRARRSRMHYTDGDDVWRFPGRIIRQ